MTEQLFSYAYPMSDDVAQSMLISETETRIHIRPTSTNALITWLHNKLIRNLLTSRKTLILVKSQEQVRMLEDILQTYEIQPLCLFFNHSRSDIEKKLMQFKPMAVSGKLQLRGFENACSEVNKRSQDILNSIKHYHQPGPEAPSSLVNILAKYIRYKSSTGFFYESPVTHLLQKEYLQLKQLLEPFSKYLKGNLPPHHVLNNLNTKSFELFLADEAWACISQNLESWIQSGTELLEEFQMIVSEFKQNEKNRILEEIKSIQDEISMRRDIHFNSGSKNIELHLLEEKLLRSFKALSENSDGSPSHFALTPGSISEDSIKEYLVRFFNQKYKKVLSEEIEPLPLRKSAKKSILKFETWVKEINASNILKEPIIPENIDLVKASKTLQNLTIQFTKILQSSHEFGDYFEWSILYGKLSEAQAIAFNHILFNHKPKLWQNALDCLYLTGIVDGDEHTAILPTLESQQELMNGLNETKNLLPGYLHSKYENHQYHAVKELEGINPILHQTISEKKPSPNTLSEHYAQTPLLSEIFPIIVMEISHPEYFPTNLLHVWDEVWNLCPDLEESFLARFEKASHRYISIFQDHAPSSHFQIALSQAPPTKLKHILDNYTSSEGWSLMSQLALFIQSNFPNFRIYANPEYHCLSFLPKSLEQLVLQWTQTEWQTISIDDANSLDKLTEILLFKGTKKKVWNCDGLFSNTTSGLQQLEWQWHFGRCLETAGFECETIWSENLYAFRNFINVADSSTTTKKSPLTLLNKT